MGIHVWIDDRQEGHEQMAEQNEQRAETKKVFSRIICMTLKASKRKDNKVI